MPLVPTPQRFRPSRSPSIPARHLNASVDLLHRLSQIRAAGGIVWSSSGPQIRRAGADFRLGMTPSSGIPGRDSQGLHGVEVTDVSLVVSAADPTLMTVQQWETTYLGFQLSSQPAAGSTIIISQWLEGAWITVWEDCPSS